MEESTFESAMASRSENVLRSPIAKDRRCCICSHRGIWIMFLGLFVLVVLNLLGSSSKLAVIVNVSMRMKSNMVRILEGGLDFDRITYMNGSLRTHAYKTRQDAKKAFSTWLRLHSNNTRTINKTQLLGELVVTPEKRTTNVSTRVIKSVTTSNSTIRRKDSCQNCFLHNFNYIINNKQICDTGADGRSNEVTLLIMITTTHQHRAARDAVRATWLSPYKDNTAQVRYAFLLGYIADAKAEQAIVEENEIHRDILKEDFIDSYNNLTYKTIMAYKWASTFCGQAACVMKTDDDMFVNVPNVIKICTQSTDIIQHSIVGACRHVARPIRNKHSKWYASENSYPQKFYPGFCSGTGYVTSMNVARHVYEISANVPLFHLEDVYVALCIKKLGYNLRPFPGFHSNRQRLDPCCYHGPGFVTSHGLNPALLKMIWHQKCISQIPQGSNNTTLAIH